MGNRIDDIARAAGVSTATVSRVLNKSDLVSPGTRDRVKAVIDELGYKPNVFARGLMRAKTDTVGILVPFITNPYHMAIVDAIEKALSARDVRIYLCDSHESSELEARYADELVRRNVDALIFAETRGINNDHAVFDAIDEGMPVILVNEHLRTDSRHHIVRCVQEPGFIDAMDHLLDHDRLPVDLVIGDGSWSFDLKERAFRDHLRRRGVAEAELSVVRLASVNVEDIVQRCARYAVEALSRKKQPRAFVAGNDMMGVGLLQGTLSAGFHVPEDVAVIGVDNSLASRLSVPPLSTVDLREADVGRLVAETYFAIKDGTAPSMPIRTVIESTFLNRGTA